MLSFRTKFVVFIVLLLTTAIFPLDTFSQVKLYKIKSIEEGSTEYPAANINWEEDGIEQSLFEKANGRTIILSFWGTWCGYCMRHIPELQKLYDYLPKEEYYFINAVGEHTSETEPAIRQVLEENQVTFDNVWYAFSEGSALQAHSYYGIDQFIATVVISPDKKIKAIIHDIIYDSFLDSLDKIMDAPNNSSEDLSISVISNPSFDKTVLKIYSSKREFVTINLFNNLGIEVTNIFDGWLTAGENNFDLSAMNLSSGLYHYNLNTNSKTYSGKLIILK